MSVPVPHLPEVSLRVSWWEVAHAALDLAARTDQWTCETAAAVTGAAVAVFPGGYRILGVCDPHPASPGIAISSAIIATPLAPYVVAHEVAHLLDCHKSGYAVLGACSDARIITEHERIAWTLAAILAVPPRVVETMRRHPQAVAQELGIPLVLVEYRLTLSALIGERPQHIGSRLVSLGWMNRWLDWLQSEVLALESARA